MESQKDKMLKMVLDDPQLREFYHYELSDYEDLYDALNSDNPVVAATAKIINELEGSTDPSVQKKVYNSVFQYLNNNLLS